MVNINGPKFSRPYLPTVSSQSTEQTIKTPVSWPLIFSSKTTILIISQCKGKQTLKQNVSVFEQKLG